MEQILLKIKDRFLIHGRGLVIVPDLPETGNIPFEPFERDVTLIGTGQKNNTHKAYFGLEHFSMNSDDGVPVGEIRLTLLIPTASIEDATGEDVVRMGEQTWLLLQSELKK